jgi:hypothetical protein
MVAFSLAPKRIGFITVMRLVGYWMGGRFSLARIEIHAFALSPRERASERFVL